MMFSPPVAAPRPHPRVVETSLEDCRVLLHLGDRRLHFLNGTASAIWETLGEASTIEELTLRLADRFEVEPAIVRPDVETLLVRLRADGLITVDDRISRVCVPADLPPTAQIKSKISFRALHDHVGIECDDDEVVSVIQGILAPLQCDVPPTRSIKIDAGADGRWRVAAGDGQPIVSGTRLAAVLRAVSEMNNFAIASVPGHLALHAGAVTGPSGSIVLPAASNSGKSTLTTALVSAGLGYLSDEVAAIGADLTCLPYPKSIALDPGSFPLFPELAPKSADGLGRAVATREWHVDPSLVGRVGLSSPVVGVVCPNWRPGAETRLCRVEPVDAMRLLLGEAFDFAEGGQQVFDILGRLVREVPVYRLGYGQLDEAVAVVSRLFDDLAQPGEQFSQSA